VIAPLRHALPVLLASLWALSGAATESSRPNFVIIFLDDLGWADPAVYGSRWHRTPNFDALAERSIRFTEAYAASPVCSPSRAALLTGRSPARLKLTDWLPGRPPDPRKPLVPATFVGELPLEEVTIAERLREAGYATAHIGKWHLGGEGFGPTDQGFDLNIAGDHTGTPRSYFYPYENEQGIMPGLEEGEPGEYLTDRLTEEAVRFMTANAGRPFFVYLAHSALHVPLEARPDILAHWRGKPAPAEGQNNPYYAAMLESVDDSIGRIITTLAELGIGDRTMIIVTSDNGGLSTRAGPRTPATSNLPLRAGKGFLYEGGLRVPLLIYRPGSPRRAAVDATPVTIMDFYPTMLEIAGLSPAREIDGDSLVPLLEGGGELEREAIFWHFPAYLESDREGETFRTTPCGAIRMGSWKLIEWFETGEVELYDLSADIGESRDLAEAAPGKREELLGALRAWRERVRAPVPKHPNPEYVAPEDRD